MVGDRCGAFPVRRVRAAAQRPHRLPRRAEGDVFAGLRDFYADAEDLGGDSTDCVRLCAAADQEDAAGRDARRLLQVC
jgi:hypothetical protein